ncbi:MAG: DUF4215 domain-containing protein [Myxococcales bacterium]|nr:DUF4215 domain-containing protein [Myxococcales bacterium]
MRHLLVLGSLLGSLAFAGVVSAQCAGGYTWNGSECVPANECASNPCGPHATECTERPLGSWVYPGYDCACMLGYGSDGFTCVVANECTRNMDDCVALARCDDPSTAPGDFTCTCPPGYVGNGRSSGSRCTDVDECASGGAICNTNAVCTNTLGSYTCACNAGWTGNGVTCTDVDECTTAGLCGESSTCTNTDGSYACGCVEHYRRVDDVCVDVDECDEGTLTCGANETCTNAVGAAAFCACAEGFSGSAGACTPVCGDGLVVEGETCDDGDTEASDGCDACAVEEGWACTGEPSVCVLTCGDGTVDPSEECDEGEENSDTASDACRTDCRLAFCGDGVVDSGESCDRGDGSSCTTCPTDGGMEVDASMPRVDAGAADAGAGDAAEGDAGRSGGGGGCSAAGASGLGLVPWCLAMLVRRRRRA